MTVRRMRTFAWVLALCLAGAGGLAAQTVTSDYQIGPKDLVEIKVLELPDLNVERRVSDSGTIELPMVGEIPISGMTAAEARSRIEPILTSKYVNRANVSVVVKEFTEQAGLGPRGRAAPGRAQHLRPLDADEGHHGRGRTERTRRPAHPRAAAGRQRSVRHARDRRRTIFSRGHAVLEHPDPAGGRHQRGAADDL